MARSWGARDANDNLRDKRDHVATCTWSCYCQLKLPALGTHRAW